MYTTLQYGNWPHFIDYDAYQVSRRQVTCPRTHNQDGWLQALESQLTASKSLRSYGENSHPRRQKISPDTQTPNSSHTQRHQTQLTEQNLKQIPHVSAQRGHHLCHRLPNTAQTIHTVTAPTPKNQGPRPRKQVKTADTSHPADRLPKHPGRATAYNGSESRKTEVQLTPKHPITLR